MGLLIFSCKRSLEVGNSEVAGDFMVLSGAQAPSAVLLPSCSALLSTWCSKWRSSSYLMLQCKMAVPPPGSCLYSRQEEGDPEKAKDWWQPGLLLEAPSSDLACQELSRSLMLQGRLVTLFFFFLIESIVALKKIGVCSVRKKGVENGYW